MVEAFSSTADTVRQYLAVLAYFLPRVAVFMIFFPVLNKGLVSTLFKTAVGTVLVLYPAFAFNSALNSGQVTASFSLIVFVAEAMLGALLGLTISLPYYAFKGLGALVDVYRGATFAAQATGSDPGEELPLEGLFGLFFAAVIFAGPGLPAITSHLLQSFLVLPPGYVQLFSLNDWILALLRLTADHVTLAVMLAMPVLIAVLLVEFIIQIVSAFAQQLQVYGIEYSLRSLFGIAMLLLVMQYAEPEILSTLQIQSKALSSLIQGVQP